MKQLALFSQDIGATAATAGPIRPDDDSTQLLAVFRDARMAEGAHPRSVKREVDQVWALAREAGSANQPATLRMLLTDVDLLARLLREPPSMISRTTGRARLLAVQRFIRIVG